MSIILKLRDGEITIKKDYFEKYLNFDWYLSSLIRFPYNEDDKGDKENQVFEIFENKNAVLSIIDSLKFSKLVIHNDVSLEYFEALCDMWLVPDWLKNDIVTRKNNIVDLNKITECKICKIGFKMSENTSTSCKSHSGYCNLQKMMTCCGVKINEAKDYCIIGYHIPIN